MLYLYGVQRWIVDDFMVACQGFIKAGFIWCEAAQVPRCLRYENACRPSYMPEKIFHKEGWPENHEHIRKTRAC